MSNENVDHPKHYNQYPIEVIDMMVSIWGVEKAIDFCLMNAFKYRMRLGHKDDIKQDLAKEQWYLNKATELGNIYANQQNVNQLVSMAQSHIEASELQAKQNDRLKKEIQNLTSLLIDAVVNIRTSNVHIRSMELKIVNESLISKIESYIKPNPTEQEA